MINYVDFAINLISECLRPALQQGLVNNVAAVAIRVFSQCIGGELPWLQDFNIQPGNAYMYPECVNRCVDWYRWNGPISPCECKTLCEEVVLGTAIY